MRNEIIFLALLILSASSLAIDAPKQLKWGMHYEDARHLLEEQNLRVGKSHQHQLTKGYREYSELQIPEGWYRVEVKDCRLLERKTQRVYLIFNDSVQLISFQYIMGWDNDDQNKGARKCWVFHEDLKQALVHKYGDPILDETTEVIRGLDIPSGITYRVRWEDSTGSLLNLLITRQTHYALIATIDVYLIFLA